MRTSLLHSGDPVPIRPMLTAIFRDSSPRSSSVLSAANQMWAPYLSDGLDNTVTFRLYTNVLEYRTSIKSTIIGSYQVLGEYPDAMCTPTINWKVVYRQQTS